MKYAILMGDAIGSMSSNHLMVQKSLTEATHQTNQKWKKEFLSPLTVTLGDEFQSVLMNFEEALRICFNIDELSRKLNVPIELRYSIVWGEISTPINSEIAHGMIGEGLQIARKLISKKTRSRKKFQVRSGKQSTDEYLNDTLFVMSSIIEKWKVKDFHLVDLMLNEANDQLVGDKFQKLRQQIYKRRKTLMIAEYQALKNVALKLASEVK